MSIDHWKARYESEKDRLLTALGRVTDSGVVESIQHIGATSLPGLPGSACVDIGLTAWPFPLEAGPRAKLAALGYQVVAGYDDRPQQRFRHVSGDFQLFIFEPGLATWYDFLLMSDYLRQDDQARVSFAAQKANPAVVKSELFEHLLPSAERWWIEHYGFQPLESVTRTLQAADFPWFVAGGWALELYAGQVQRLHHDVDIIVPRDAQLALQKFLLERSWQLLTPFEKRLERWPLHMRLELPRHQVHAHQGADFIDFLLTDIGEVWHYRREPHIIRLRERMSLLSPTGIPYLAPELVLLFKSRNTSDQERAKDPADFERAWPRLEPERRAWLRWALTATDPEHPWLSRL